jgi:hypothetical protein
MTSPFNRIELIRQLDLYYTFVTNNIRDTFPMFASTKYIAPNSIFLEVGGRQNYFPKEAATSEAMCLLARSYWRIYDATFDIKWKNLAIAFTDSYAKYFYLDNPFTWNISAGVNSEFCRSHWLCIAYGSVVSEGLQSGNDPFNYGYFLSANFSGGVATLETDLSKFFRAYTGRLYYKNIYAPVIDGTDYPINYWVSGGYRQYPNGDVLATAEPNGKVVLTTAYTGVLNVAYTRRNGATVNPPASINSGQGLVEPYPILFPCVGSVTYTGYAFDAAWWAYEAYSLAYKHTNDNKYNNAALVTKYNTLRYMLQGRESYFYQKSVSSEPLRTPGSYLISTNTSGSGGVLTPAVYTATRETTGGLAKYLKLVVSAIVTTPSNSYPTMELQNYAETVSMDGLVSISIETQISTACNLKMKLSINPDPNNFTQEYIAFFPVAANVLTSKTFTYKEFYSVKNMVWHPWIAENPLFTFNGAVFTWVERTFGTIKKTMVQATIPNNTAGIGLINSSYTSQIPFIEYSLVGNCQLRIASGGVYYYYDLSDTSGEISQLKISWTDLGYSDRLITEMVFLTSTSAVLQLGWIGNANNGYPDILPTPTTVYKASISCELKTAYTWYIGDFKPSNNLLNSLKYTPGCIPFTINTLNGEKSGFNAWQFYAAYQSAYSLQKWGYPGYASNVVTMLNDAQEAYTNQSNSRSVGLLQQVFLPYSPENIGYLNKQTVIRKVSAFPIPFLKYKTYTVTLQSYKFNIFSWQGLDPNTQWAPYNTRAVRDLSRYASDNRNDYTSKKILQNYIRFTYDYDVNYGIKPITNIKPGVPPTSEYFEPHQAAMEGETAIECNRSNIETSKSWQIIKNKVDFITSEFVEAGVMRGLWCKSQPDSVVGGTTYKQFFSFWAAEIGNFYASCLLFESELNDASDVSYPTFPIISCYLDNNVADMTMGSERSQPMVVNQYADGNKQRIHLSRSANTDRVYTLKYTHIKSIEYRQFVTFYNQVKGVNNRWQFDINNMNYSEYSGLWVFDEKPDIQRVVIDGIYDITIKIRKVL